MVSIKILIWMLAIFYLQTAAEIVDTTSEKAVGEKAASEEAARDKVASEEAEREKKIVGCCNILIESYSLKDKLPELNSTDGPAATKCKESLRNFLKSREFESADKMEQICKEVSGKVYHGEDVVYLLEFQQKYEKEAKQWSKSNYPYSFEKIKTTLINGLILNGKLEVKDRKLSILFEKTKSDYEFWYRELSRKNRLYACDSEDVYYLLEFPQHLDLYVRSKKEILEIDCPFMVINWIAMAYQNIERELTKPRLLALMRPVFKETKHSRVVAPKSLKALVTAFDENGLHEMDMGKFLSHFIKLHLLLEYPTNGIYSLSNAVRLALNTCEFGLKTTWLCHAQCTEIVVYLNKYKMDGVIEDFERISHEKNILSLKRYVIVLYKIAYEIHLFTPGSKNEKYLSEFKNMLFMIYYTTKWTFTEEAYFRVDGEEPIRWTTAFYSFIDEVKKNLTDDTIKNTVEIFRPKLNEYLTNCRENRKTPTCTNSANVLWNNFKTCVGNNSFHSDQCT